MKRRPVMAGRLDQAVGRILVRLGGLAVFVVALAALSNLWRGSFTDQATGFTTADEALASVHAGMLDQETGLRGFLEARDASFLQPYYAGLRETASGNNQLAAAVVGDPQLVDEFVDFRLAQDTWETQWVAPALVTPPGTLSTFLAEGRHLFDAYRATESTLDAALVTRIGIADSRASAVGWGALAAEAIFLAVGSVVWWRSQGLMRRAVVGPVEAILAALGKIEAGDYSSLEPTEVGPLELRMISRRLAVVSSRLEAANAAVRRREAEAEDHAARLHLMLEMGRQIAGSLSLRYVLQAISESVSGIGAFQRCILWLADDTNTVLTPAHDSRGVKGHVSGLEPIQVGEQVVGRAARFGRVTGPEAVSHPDADEPWESAVAVPMIVGGRTVGVIEIAMDGRATLPTPLLELLNTLASQAATALEAARLYEQAEQRGRTDALTLLPNRRELEPALRVELSRAQRYQRPLSIAMVDIDHFKAVNDTYGHTRGDEVLRETASALRALVREVDSVYRYGGEEFVVVMPETDADAAFSLLDRLRAAVSKRVRVRAGQPLTVSVGVVSIPADGDTPAELIAAADSLLYRAKSEGRDRVVSSADHTLRETESRVIRVPARGSARRSARARA